MPNRSHKNIKGLLRALALPIFFGLIMLTAYLLWKLFDFPPPDRALEIVRGYFDRYGYLVVFVSAFIEGALILGFYFPGGFIISLSVILAGQDILRIILLIFVVAAAFVSGYTVDYFVGRYGWQKVFAKLGFSEELKKSKKRLERKTFRTIFLTYFDVNLASITATAAGILHYPYARFLLYSIPAVLFWNAFWAVIIYWVGQQSLEFITGGALAVVVLVIWVIVTTVRYFTQSHHRESWQS
ncbi:MAG: VTT domain-containing protein [bacterium]|nr:VTT domain-containing protein [bacterium]